MDEQRTPKVERVIRTYGEGLGWGVITEVETVERGDGEGEDSFLSIVFNFGGGAKMKIDEEIARKLFALVMDINEK